MQEAYDEITLGKKRAVKAIRESSNNKISIVAKNSIKKTKEFSSPLKKKASIDTSGSESEFSDGYDGNLYAGQADKKYLQSLSEKDREFELFRRAENREILRLHWETERRIKQSKKEKDRAELANNSIKTKSAVEVNDSHTTPLTSALPSVNGTRFPTSQTKFPKHGRSHQEEMSSDQSEELDSKRRRKKVTEPHRKRAMAELKAKHIQQQEKKKRLAVTAKAAEYAKEAAEAAEQRELEMQLQEALRNKKSSSKWKASEIYSDDSDTTDDERDSASKIDVPVTIKGAPPPNQSMLIKENSSTAVRPPFTKEALQQICLSRFRLGKFISLPFFDQLVKNSVVRLSLGNARSNLHIYRIAEIMAVVKTPRFYQFGTTRTNKSLILRHGDEEHTFRMEYISNQAVTDAEFKQWFQICTKANALPTPEFLEQKTIQIREAKNYEFREEDIDKILEEKNRSRSNHTNYAMRKTVLLQQRGDAEMQGDTERLDELTKAIIDLDERADELDKKRTSRISSIAFLNHRNRMLNIEDAEKHLLSEARSNTGIKMEDPFTRRQTKPRMKYIPTIEQEEKEEHREQIQTSHITNPGKYGQEPRKSMEADEIDFYAMHDFEIDFDAPLQLN